MAFIKYLVPALSAAATAYAASCSTTATMTIQSGGDASAIGACGTFSGSIAVATGVGTTIDFGNVQEITGSLNYAEDSTIQTISANSLDSLGSLNLTDLSALATLNLDKLSKVGDFSIVNAGVLTNINVPDLEQIGNLHIVNTQIAGLDGFDTLTDIAGIDLSDNNFLGNISFALSSFAAKGQQTLNIGPNNPNGQTLDFPNLATANMVTLRNATEISVPSLTNVTGLFFLDGNKFQTFSAPKLVWAGGVVVNDNSQLTNLTFPQLAAVNSSSNSTLQVANNTKLSDIDGFPKLKLVLGDVDLSGNIDNITLSAISQINGALNVDTSSSTFSCDSLPQQSSQVVRGATHCKNADPNPTGTTTGGDGSGSGTDSGGASSSTTGAAVPLDVPAWMTGASVFGGLIAFLL